MKQGTYTTFFFYSAALLLTSPALSSAEVALIAHNNTLFVGIATLFFVRILPSIRKFFSFNRHVQLLGHDPHIAVPTARACNNKAPLIILPGYNSWRSSLPAQQTDRDQFSIQPAENTHITIRFADTIRREYRWLPLQWIKCITSANMGQLPDAITLLCGLIECHKKGHKKVNSFWYSRGGPAGIYALDMLVNPKNYHDVWRSFGYVDADEKLNIKKIEQLYHMVTAGTISITYPILQYHTTFLQCCSTAFESCKNFFGIRSKQQPALFKLVRTLVAPVKQVLFAGGMLMLRVLTRFRSPGKNQEPIDVLIKLLQQRPELRTCITVNFAEIDQITGNGGQQELQASGLVSTKVHNGDHFSIKLPLTELQKKLRDQ